jgi:hypothetical protein
MFGAVPPLPYTSLWYGPELKAGTTFTYLQCFSDILHRMLVLLLRSMRQYKGG